VYRPACERTGWALTARGSCGRLNTTEELSVKTGMPWPARHRTALTVALPGVLVAAAFLHPAQFHLLWPGAAVALLGQSLRLWAAGCLHKDSEITTRGPFAFTRNPLYLGSFVIGLGHCLMSGLLWSAVLLPLFWAVYHPTIRHEEGFLRRKFGEAYDAYCHQTPRLFPRVPPRELLRTGFSWSQLRRNREYEALIANAVAALLFALAARGG